MKSARQHLVVQARLYVFIFALVVACMSCGSNSAYKENVMISANSLQALCIGRFVIELPSDWQPIPNTAEYLYAGHDLIAKRNVNLVVFDEIVKKRVQELKDKRRMDKSNPQGPDVKTNIPWLEINQIVASHAQALIYADTAKTILDIADVDLYKSEGYVWSSKIMLTAIPRATFHAAEDAVPVAQDVLPRLEGRPNNELPTKPGYCFDGGFVSGTQKFNESAGITYENPAVPSGVIFAIETRPSLAIDDELLDRVSGFTKALGNLLGNARTLRRGERSIAGLDGQEMLIKISAGGVDVYNFIWEFKGKRSGDGQPMDVIHPHARLELRIGDQKPTGDTPRTGAVLSEEQALALWDRILKSFRLRPGAV